MESLEVRDLLDDTMEGVRLWRDAKVANATWTSEDEQLMRWLTHHKELNDSLD